MLAMTFYGAGISLWLTQITCPGCDSSQVLLQPLTGRAWDTDMSLTPGKHCLAKAKTSVCSKHDSHSEYKAQLLLLGRKPITAETRTHIKGIFYFNVKCSFDCSFFFFSNSIDFTKYLQSGKKSKEVSHLPCIWLFDPRQIQHCRQGRIGADFQLNLSVVSATFSRSFLISVIAPIHTISL